MMKRLNELSEKFTYGLNGHKKTRFILRVAWNFLH